MIWIHERLVSGVIVYLCHSDTRIWNNSTRNHNT